MKSIFVLALNLCIFMIGSAQNSPVTWVFTVDRSSTAAESELVATATIETHWNIYSMTMGSDGPVPTSFTIEPSSDYELVGEFDESPKPKVIYDELFGMDVAKLKDKAVYKQKIKVKKPGATLKGYVTYMCCDNEKCLPPKEVSFTLPL